MSAVAIQRCANGFICSVLGEKDPAACHVFPMQAASDPAQRDAFMAWIVATTAQPVPVAPAEVKAELRSVSDTLSEPANRELAA